MEVQAWGLVMVAALAFVVLAQVFVPPPVLVSVMVLALVSVMVLVRASVRGRSCIVPALTSACILGRGPSTGRRRCTGLDGAVDATYIRTTAACGWATFGMTPTGTRAIRRPTWPSRRSQTPLSTSQA